MESRLNFIIITMSFTIFTISLIVYVKSIDIINTRLFLYFSSFYYLGLNPYPFARIPTPPIFLSILLPQFGLYVTTFSLQSVSDFFRIVNLIFSLFASFVLLKIVSKMTNNKNKLHASFYMFLLSPFLFYVNYIHVEQDIIVIFLTLVSFYFICFSEKLLVKTAGAILLAYASFFYLFPILLIPSILVYQKSKKDSIFLFILLASAILLFYASFLANLNWNVVSNGVGLSTAPIGGPGVSIFTIWNVLTKGPFYPFTPFLARLYDFFLIFVIFLVISIPVILRYFKKPIILSIAITFSVFFMFLNIYNGDEFIWILPFVTIAIAYVSKEKLMKTRILLSQMYMLPLLILFNMWDAPGYGEGTGIFYLTYEQFHTPIALYSLVPHFVTASKLLDLLIFLLIFANVLYLLLVTRKKSTQDSVQVLGNSVKIRADQPKDNKHFDESRSLFFDLSALLKNLKKASGSFKKSHKERENKAYAITSILILALICMAVFAPLPTGPGQTLTYSGGPFPLGFFASTNYEMVKNLSYDYTTNNSFIELSNYSGGLVVPPLFTRNIEDQQLQMNIKADPEVPLSSTILDPIAGFNGLNVSFVNQLNAVSNLTYLRPNESVNVTPGPIGEIGSIGVGAIQAYELNGASFEQYNITPKSVIGDSYLLAFKPSILNYSENLVFYFQINGISYELFFNGASLTFAYENNVWKFVTVDPAYYNEGWNIVRLSLSANTIGFYIDGNLLYESTTNLYAGGVNFIGVGMAWPYYESYYHKYAFTGIVTPLMITNTSSLYTVKKLVVSYDNQTKLLPFPSGYVTIDYNGSGVKIVSNGEVFSVLGKFNQFWFGRTSQYSPGVEYSFQYLIIESANNNSLFIRIIILLYGIPAWVALVVLLEKRKGYPRTNQP